VKTSSHALTPANIPLVRVTKTLALCSVLGSVITLAFAWHTSLFGEFANRSSLYPLIGLADPGIFLRRPTMTISSTDQDYAVITTGFPFRAFERRIGYDHHPYELPHLNMTHASCLGGLAIPGDRALPLFPVVSGLLLDVALWSAASWLLFVAPFTYRRLSRRRRGLCLRCAYPLVDGHCPECGR